MWFAASFKILQFSQFSLLIIVALVAVFFLTLFIVNSSIFRFSALLKYVRSQKSVLILILVEELLFFFCLLLWSYVRGFQPVIEGLEKYMDFGFINAILKSKYFPPRDMWLSGYTINYYYFGHLIAAVLTILSMIPQQVVYNLMIAVIFALCFVSSFSIGLNLFYHFLKLLRPHVSLRSLIFPALLTAYLVTNAANLQPIYHLLTKGSSTYWYPDATRFIVKKFGATDETIHEFPHYSYVVADLHGHVSDIPTVLLLIAFIFVLFLKVYESHDADFARGELAEKGWGPFNKFVVFRAMPFTIFEALFLGFLLSTAYMTNAMDGPVYFALAGLAVFGSLFFVSKKFMSSFIQTAIFFVFAGLTFVICSYPFLINFKNFTGAVTPVDFHSPLWMLGILWGFQFFMAFSFLLFLFAKKIGKRENLARAFASFFGVKIKVLDQKTVKESNLKFVDLFIIFLFAISLFLIVFPEIFYIKDIYIHEYQRANTMFKMTYQAFIMLYIAVPYVFFRILYHIKTHKNILFFFPTVIFLFASVFGLISVSIYPYFAVRSYYGLVNYQGLDGTKYISALYPDDYKLITTLNSPNYSSTFSEAPIILEAVGDSYTKYARISANTGVSIVLGWPVHEWLWRNGYDIPGKRTADVQRIYESESASETKLLLKEYKVNYVWVGQLEREKYKNLDEKKFGEIGKVFLKFGNSELYKVN